MSNPSHIFNVNEVTGKEHSALETTAAEARIEAPNALAAHQVDINSEKAHEAAEQAASFAKTMGTKCTGEPTTAVDQFREGASRTTNAAVSEGKTDVDHAKATGAEYVRQAKDYANSAIDAAQGYLPTTIGGRLSENNSGTGVVESVQTTATNVYVAAKEAVQPHIEKVQGVAQEYLGTAGIIEGTPTSTPTPASPGLHTFDTPKAAKVDVTGSGASPSTAARN